MWSWNQQRRWKWWWRRNGDFVYAIGYAAFVVFMYSRWLASGQIH
jgi:hypothetical protein